MLAGYRGYLQVDAAPAYDDVFAQYPGIVEVGWMAHARRYFKEAMPTSVPCAQALALIGQLYRIERAASERQLDAPVRQGLRQEQALPIVEKLHSYLQEHQAVALPKSPLGAPSATRCATGSPPNPLHGRWTPQNRQQRG
jgi:transposase